MDICYVVLVDGGIHPFRAPGQNTIQRSGQRVIHIVGRRPFGRRHRCHRRVHRRRTLRQGEQLIATSGFGLMVAGISLELHDRPKSVKLFLRGRLVVHHGRQFRDSWLSNRFRGWGQS